EIEVGGVLQRGGPRYPVVHGEQPGRIERNKYIDEAPLGGPPRSVSLGEGTGGVKEFRESPRLLPRSGRRRHPSLGEKPFVVEEEVSGPLLRECVLAPVEREGVIQRRDAVRLQFRRESLIASQHGVEVQQHTAGG